MMLVICMNVPSIRTKMPNHLSIILKVTNFGCTRVYGIFLSDTFIASVF